MKNVLLVVVAAICIGSVSCMAGKGCPSSGRNMGAEKVNDAINGDKKAQKLLKKAGKFRH